jgi:phage gp16-like protein
MAKHYSADQRRKDLAAIHAAKRDLALDDDSYRDLLWSVARVRSAGDLDQAGRNKVLDHLRACGWKPMAKNNEWAFIDTAARDRQPLLRKICAVCRNMKVGKAYAEGVALRQHGIERKLEMMAEHELWMVAAALENTRRHRQENAE